MQEIESDDVMTADYAPGFSYYFRLNKRVWNTDIPKWVKDEFETKNNIIMKDYYSISNQDVPYDDSYMEEIVLKKGIFSVKYTMYSYPNNIFNAVPMYKYNEYTEKEAHFYVNNKLLFTRTYLPHSPSIIIYGDGENVESTYFTMVEKKDYFHELSIFNFNNSKLRTPCFGPDGFCELKQINDNYALSTTNEMFMSYTAYTGLIDLNILFNNPNNVEKRPYDNSRQHIPLEIDLWDGGNSLSTLIATKDGFIVYDMRNNHILPNIIPYEKAFGYDEDNDWFDFYSDCPDQIEIIKQMNLVPNEKIDKAVELINNNLTTSAYIKKDNNT